MKQTAVEWLFKQMPIKIQIQYKTAYEQAKEMEKEQIELAHIDGGKNQRTAVKYYNEIFKSE